MPGDQVVIRPGEDSCRCGSYGGCSHVDEALITGESKPVRKEPGFKVTGAQSIWMDVCWSGVLR